MSELKPLPCPACGNLHPSIASGPHEITGEWCSKIKCYPCGMCGPEVFASEDVTIKEWNNLPRALHWTTEPPKVAGWYWYSMGKGHAVCLLVCADGKAKLGKDHFTDAELLGGEWAGPIPAPLEAHHDSH